MIRFSKLIPGLLLALSILSLQTNAQLPPADARATSSRVPFLSSNLMPGSAPAVERVSAVGMTVSDMDRSIVFYSRVLLFEKVSDVEITGDDFERLEGVFG